MLAGGVKKNDCGGGIEFRFAESGGRGVANFGESEVGVAADARRVVVDKGAALFAARFAEHEEADFHREKNSGKAVTEVGEIGLSDKGEERSFESLRDPQDDDNF